MTDRVLVTDRAGVTDKTVTTEKVITTENLKYYMSSYLSSNSAPQAEACIPFMSAWISCYEITEDAEVWSCKGYIQTEGIEYFETFSLVAIYFVFSKC